ncbi:alpha-ketoglutarate decarboxylase [Aurantibacter crassamenti]|uniref:alpha-ketoglutarate decarboxylase n=1 Tax=Aurantibacter crassamenti TaxID=1837375 RepID=UPI001939F48D|nr:alpha-ketoglutarate decarboxylase [Aurantibacter crassamenti]MBM1104526.1 alpha-ketoglutarate decarboxylase [Aurantibacter crassamenti]
MKRLSIQLVLILAAFFISVNSSAQTTEIMVADSASVVDKRLKFGCGFGLSFVGGTNITLSPNLMYSVSNQVSIGAGVQGSYTSIKDLQNTTTFGGNVIAQYNPIPMMTTLLEFAQLKVNTKTETVTGEVEQDYWDSALFVGLGLNVSKNIIIGAKYNLLYDKDESVYTSPILPFVNISF